ncbi:MULTISPECIES: acyl-CoA dehydrogenase family protein [Nocardioides]|uniref:Acyl-CoA dehydrogenase family protein n=1 Tax=Nocardioides vastitatis TaxID=2568655 RepID=A0ABW0ZJH0_9ACTN|nr:acyl-CoA dehydrogenase family protein [Nocardioides sp.]THJ02726.1 acyl-CoA dehydrogenase [Nocardioides sp.]
MTTFNHGWSPEQLALKQTAIDFTHREVTPHLAAWERDGEIPREFQKRLAHAGLLGVGVPEEVGGDGGDLMDVCAMQEGFMEAGWSGGLMAGAYTHGIAIPHIVQAGSPELIDTFVRPVLSGDLIGSLAITEPGTGSDVAAITTRAVRDGDQWVINGAKMFITSSVRGDFVTTAVRTGGDGAHGISLIVVPQGTPGFTVSRKLDKMGWLCSDTGELSYDDVRVPDRYLVGEENHGFYYIADQFVTERIWLALMGYGHALRCLNLTLRHCQERDTFGKPLVANQVVRAKLTEMHRQVAVARSYTLEVAQRHVAGESVVAEACLAKQTAVDTAVWVADQAVQLHGGAGYLRESEVERHYRDVRLLPIGGGATEVLTDLAARLLGYGVN